MSAIHICAHAYNVLTTMKTPADVVPTPQMPHATQALVQCAMISNKAQTTKTRITLHQTLKQNLTTYSEFQVQMPKSNENVAILTNNLTRKWGEITAVENITLSVNKGSITVLLGENGAGKTTLLRLLATALPQSSGTANIAGIDILENPITARENIGFLPEGNPLPEEFRVCDLLKYRALIYTLPTEYIDDAIDAWGLEEYENAKIHTLSLGFKKRVGLCLATMHKPSVLLLDEPTAGLDPTQIKIFTDHLKRISSSGVCVVLSTHDLSITKQLATRVLFIKNAHIYNDISDIDGNTKWEELFLSSPETEGEK